MFNAIQAERVGDRLRVALTQLSDSDLPDEDVTVAVAYSSLNYKDALAVTGAFPVIRRYPMVPGIDLTGTVEGSNSAQFSPGDAVLVNGWGLSEVYWGGYSQRQRLRPEWLVRVPEAFTVEQTMAIGTAGYTAMLCVMALEEAGVDPRSGEILVTGASGGVGSLSIALLSRLGFTVVASTGRAKNEGWLRSLGASRVIERHELAGSAAAALEEERWAGAVDTVAGETLATVIRQTVYGGAIAAAGLVGGADVRTSMLPFVVRGVRLLGVDSVRCPMARRVEAWRRLARDLPGDVLQEVTTIEPLGSVLHLAAPMLAGEIRGRVVIDVNA